MAGANPALVGVISDSKILTGDYVHSCRITNYMGVDSVAKSVAKSFGRCAPLEAGHLCIAFSGPETILGSIGGLVLCCGYGATSQGLLD